MDYAIGCILPALWVFCFIFGWMYDWATDEMRIFFAGDDDANLERDEKATKSNAIVKSNPLKNNSDETNACSQVCLCV